MCVDKCISTYYPDESSRKCLECDQSCYGCTGPLNTMGPGGCTSCYSALVNNDNGFSIIKCIKRVESNCSAAVSSSSLALSRHQIIKNQKNDSFKITLNGDDEFSTFRTFVPDNLPSHPLRGKTVCRKCNQECDGCFANGAKLGEGCRKCRNFYSNETNECVSSCSKYNEYQEVGTKVQCFFFLFFS